MDLKKARELAIDMAPELGMEEVGLESALCRVLGADITAARDLPGQCRSRWDGFALRSADTGAAGPDKPVLLDIAPGFIPAGNISEVEAASGVCFRIMTGAVIPGGADAVIPFEDATTRGERLVIQKPVRPRQGTVSPVADAAAGDLILEKGDVLTPARIALAAATGIGRIAVRRRPRVAILSTGDELRETGGDAAGPVIFCNDIHLLSGLVSVSGGEPVNLGIAPDDPEAIFSRLENVRSDLVITTGGMGGGKKDFILEVWKRLGVIPHFDSLNISPGKGSALGTLGERIFLGLPGNPWAARIIFEEIASPMIRRMQGARISATIDARAAAAIENNKGFHRAIYGSLDISGGAIFFLPVEPHPSRAFLSIMRDFPAYTVLSPGRGAVRKGDIIEVKLPDLALDARAVLNT